MKPDFRVTANKKDITATIRDRLLEIRVIDAAGMESDTCAIRLDDRAPAIALPQTGAELDIFMGYKSTGLSNMGLFTVDELSLSGPPDTLTIKARAAKLRSSLKAPRTRSWDGVTIEALVATIASEHSYTPHVDEVFKAIQLPHEDQTEESDLHLLTRLAKVYGAVAKPAGGLLIFAPKGAVKSLTGKTLPTVAFVKEDLTRWSVTLAERGKYSSVSARWRDLDAAEDKIVTVGSGEPVFTMRRSYPDEASAKAAATAKLSAFNRGEATIEATLPGDTGIAAEGKVSLSGVRPGVDGEWLITSATHALSTDGYSCIVEGETP